MAKQSTFPTDDVPDRSDLVLAVMRDHAPVPVPTTTLYLAIPDKRALAETFERLEADGQLQSGWLQPEDEHYQASADLAQVDPELRSAPLSVFRLGAAGPS